MRKGVTAAAEDRHDAPNTRTWSRIWRELAMASETSEHVSHPASPLPVPPPDPSSLRESSGGGTELVVARGKGKAVCGGGRNGSSPG